jgi:hypothetical protein
MRKCSKCGCASVCHLPVEMAMGRLQAVRPHLEAIAFSLSQPGSLLASAMVDVITCLEQQSQHTNTIPPASEART